MKFLKDQIAETQEPRNVFLSRCVDFELPVTVCSLLASLYFHDHLPKHLHSGGGQSHV